MMDMLFRRPGWSALLAGALSATGFAPLSLWPVTLAMLALWLALIARADSWRGAATIGYLFGLGQFTVGLNWIAHAFTFQDAMPHWLGWLAVPLLSVYLAVYPAMAAVIGWRIGQGRPVALVLATAGAWVLTEYLRATMFTGFAWNPLGVMWLGTGVDQVARLIGTYGLGALAVIAGGGLWLGVKRQWRPAVLMLAPLVVMAGWGGLSARVLWLDGSAIVRVVQPNINQNEKYSPELEVTNFHKLAELTGSPSVAGRLIFWPEAAVPAILDREPAWRARIASLLGPNDLLLLGGEAWTFNDKGKLVGAHNSVWVLDAAGALRGRYDKAHLVPYGEYLPMRPILSAIGLSRLVPGDIDFWPGPGPRTLALPPLPQSHPGMKRQRRTLKVGFQLCYEIIFSGQVVDSTNRPSFIFNPSNDAWFGAWGPPQHLAQARLRAVEEGLPVIRSTPTGISAVVDSRGNLVGSIPHHEAGALEAGLPPADGPTSFALYGNVVPILFALILLVSAIALQRRNR